MNARSERVVAENISDISPVIPANRREVLSTFMTGLFAGVVMIVTYILLNKFVFGSVMCRAGNDASCSSAPTYAITVAFVVGAVVGLIGLVQTRSYRPLLTVLATTVGLWGLQNLLGDMLWYWAIVVGAILVGFSYLLFAWIGRLRSFTISLILSVIIVVLIRIAIVS